LASFCAFCGAPHSCGVASLRACGEGVDAPWKRSQRSWGIGSLGAFCAATRPHLASDICHPAFVIRHPCISIPHSEFRIFRGWAVSTRSAARSPTTAAPRGRPGHARRRCGAACR